jgi:hypothetical protein
VSSTLTRNRLPSATLTSSSSPGVAKKRFIRSLPVRTVRWEVRTTHHVPRRHPSRDPLHALATQHGKAYRRGYGRSLGIIVYCCPTAAKPLVFALRVLGFLRYLQEKKRADERTRTADLISLRVCGQGLQRLARGCKSRIFKRLSLLRAAACCTVLRSRWYQIGIRTSDSHRLTAGPMARPRVLRSHNRRCLFIGVAVCCRIGLSIVHRS